MNEETHPLIANQRTVRSLRKMAADEATSAIASSKLLATVKTANPFTIVLDGASKAVPAHYLSSYTPLVGDRVGVEVFARQFMVVGKRDTTIIPNSVTPFDTFQSLGDGSSSGQWTTVLPPFFVFTRSYIVQGPLVAYTFPGFAQSVASNTKIGLVAISAKLSAGTATIDITQQAFGGSPATIAGLTGIAVTTTDSGYLYPTTEPTPVTDRDRFSFEVSSPAGTGDIVVDYAYQMTVNQ